MTPPDILVTRFIEEQGQDPLVRFLLARIAEDQKDADDEDREYAHTSLLPTIDSDHQARWHTDRARAECQAKRRIIEHHSIFPKEPTWCEIDEQDYPCQTILALAQPYVDHEDFRAEWRMVDDE